MDQKQNNSSGFTNGLLLGLVLGAGIVFLLTTKRGKRILHTLSEEGLDSVHSLDDLYKKLEKAVSQEQSSENEEELTEEKPRTVESPLRKPVLLAHDLEVTQKLEEVKERFNQEIEGVSEVIASTYVPYANDEEPIEEEEAPVSKVKPTRRRFFRGIPRRA